MKNPKASGEMMIHRGACCAYQLATGVAPHQKYIQCVNIESIWCELVCAKIHVYACNSIIYICGLQWLFKHKHIDHKCVFYNFLPTLYIHTFFTWICLRNPQKEFIHSPRDSPKRAFPFEQITHHLKQIQAGWWLTYPSEKYEFVSWGDYSQYGKIKNVPNHQPASV